MSLMYANCQEVRKILRKTKLYGILFFTLMVFLVVGCTDKYNYATDEPFIVVTSYSAGPDDYREMYEENVAIDHDGKLVLYTIGDDDLIIKQDAPILEVQLNDEQINQVKKDIEEKGFWKLPSDVSTPSEDGGFAYITVNLIDETKEVGGLNPDDERFNDIFQSAWSLVDGEDYQSWTEEIEEHIWENNSLRSSQKTDYRKDEPFLLLSVEQIWAEDFSNVYHHHISIDMDGNLVLFAEAESHVKIGHDAPELTVQLTDNELEEVQGLIQEHFWKLNVFLRNADGDNRMESITVHLTEEEKTVRGEDPNRPRFITIRDQIINLVDEEEYESWIGKIEKYIEKENPDLNNPYGY